MAKIEFGFSQKDAYDFTIKNVRRETEVEGKKIVEKLQDVVFKNPDIANCGYVKRMTAENAPKALKNVQYFYSPNPFGKFGLGKQYEDYGWTLPMVILAFKKGYIDGWLGSTGGLFQPLGNLKVDAITIVDPIQRIEVRKYFEEEFKSFLDNCKEEDFEYSIYTNWGYAARLGTSRCRANVEEVLNEFKEDMKDGREFFKTEHEKAAVAEHGFDKVLEALANLCYYDNDLWNLWGQRTAKPMTFDSKEGAEDFVKQYKEWEVTYREEEKKSLDVAPVNENFEAWVREQSKAA